MEQSFPSYWDITVVLTNKYIYVIILKSLAFESERVLCYPKDRTIFIERGVIQIISQEKFLEIFKETKFSRDELVNFYKSIKRSISYHYAGKRAYYKLVEIERAYQWPILSRIDNPTLSIYRRADERLLNAFMNSIRDEKHVRSNTANLTPRDCWIIFRILITSRIELYENIFGLTKDELAQYKKIGERYEKTLIYREKRSLKTFGLRVGIAAGGAAVALTAYYNYKKKRTDDA